MAETRLSQGASSPLARRTSSLFQLQQSQSVKAPLVPVVFSWWLSRWRGPHWGSVSGACWTSNVLAWSKIEERQSIKSIEIYWSEITKIKQLGCLRQEVSQRSNPEAHFYRVFIVCLVVCQLLIGQGSTRWFSYHPFTPFIVMLLYLLCFLQHISVFCNTSLFPATHHMTEPTPSFCPATAYSK